MNPATDRFSNLCTMAPCLKWLTAQPHDALRNLADFVELFEIYPTRDALDLRNLGVFSPSDVVLTLKMKERGRIP